MDIFLPLSSFFYANFDVKSIIFPNFGQGHFPKIAGEIPVGGPRHKKTIIMVSDSVGLVPVY